MRSIWARSAPASVASGRMISPTGGHSPAPSECAAAAPNTPLLAALAAGSKRHKTTAASVARNMARRPHAVGHSRLRCPVPDTALGLTDHLDHSSLDEASGAFEPGFVELLGEFDRF